MTGSSHVAVAIEAVILAFCLSAIGHAAIPGSLLIYTTDFSAAPLWANNNGATSGTLGPARDGWAVPMGDTLTYYTSPSAAACRSDCTASPACNGYTWVKPGAYQPGDPPMCYLMRSIEAMAPNPCCITATKSDGTAVPGPAGTGGRLEGRWQWRADCSGAIGAGQWLITAHDPMGPFRGRFEGSSIHTGLIDGVTGDTRSSYGGISFTRTLSGRTQQWTGEFASYDQNAIRGTLTDPTHADCNFTARKCLDPACASVAPWAGSGVTAEHTPGTLLEELYVPNDKPERVASQTTLHSGRKYIIEATGVFSDWSGVSDGVDAVWCYAEWRCGKDGQAWNQLRINDKGLNDIAGKAIAFDPQHRYRAEIVGNDQKLVFHLHDALGSWQDNSGGIAVRLYASDAIARPGPLIGGVTAAAPWIERLSNFQIALKAGQYWCISCMRDQIPLQYQQEIAELRASPSAAGKLLTDEFRRPATWDRDMSLAIFAYLLEELRYKEAVPVLGQWLRTYMLSDAERSPHFVTHTIKVLSGQSGLDTYDYAYTVEEMKETVAAIELSTIGHSWKRFARQIANTIVPPAAATKTTVGGTCVHNIEFSGLNPTTRRHETVRVQATSYRHDLGVIRNRVSDPSRVDSMIDTAGKPYRSAGDTPVTTGYGSQATRNGDCGGTALMKSFPQAKNVNPGQGFNVANNAQAEMVFKTFGIRIGKPADAKSKKVAGVFKRGGGPKHFSTMHRDAAGKWKTVQKDGVSEVYQRPITGAPLPADAPERKRYGEGAGKPADVEYYEVANANKIKVTDPPFCTAGPSRLVLSGSLTAHWRNDTRDPEEPGSGSCSSGRLRIDFDDEGIATDGVWETDCFVYYKDHQPIGTHCPPSPENRVADQAIHHIEANLAAGQIKARVGAASDDATLTGRIERQGSQSPYTYVGSGSVQSGAIAALGGTNRITWQTSPPLGCQ